MLKEFFTWATKHKITSFNPLEDVAAKKGGVKKENPKRTPFTEKEITAILSAFKNNTHSLHKRFKHSHYYPFIFYIFSTGVRNAEAVGVRVGHLDFDKDLITVSEVLARGISKTHSAARIRKETKNGKVRQIPMSPELKEILLQQVEGKAQEGLVFTSPKGMAIDDRMFQKRIFKPTVTVTGGRVRAQIGYESSFTTVLSLDHEHAASVIKDRTKICSTLCPCIITAGMGALLYEWSNNVEEEQIPDS